MKTTTLFIGGYAYERISKAKARQAFDTHYNDICITDGGCRYNLFQTTDGDALAWWDRISFDEELEALEWRIGHKLRHPCFYNLSAPVVQTPTPYDCESDGAFRPDADGNPVFVNA